MTREYSLQETEPTYRRFVIADALTGPECDRLSKPEGGFRPLGVQVDEGEAVGSESRTSWGAQLNHGGDTDWLVDRLHPHILKLNAYFRFQISGYEAPHVLRYEPGQHYAWHADLGRDDIATRKLSVILLLSASGDYEGGELEWMPDLGPCSRVQGSLIVFPSFMPHRVTAVSSGERFALVTWVHGDQPFR